MKEMIFTINRLCGSGGREIGQQLSKKLNIPFYDKNLMRIASKRSGISQEYFEKNDENSTNSLLYAFAVDGISQGMPMNHTLFMAQFETIQGIAKKGPCVFVGRCADYVLKDRKNKVSVFIHADAEVRLERLIKVYDVPESQAKGLLARTDRQRESYYSQYTGRNWKDTQNYELSIDSGVAGLEGAVDIILHYAQIKAERFLID